jgi:CubicO group peptidase (beta-lactamase class C family)
MKIRGSVFKQVDRLLDTEIRLEHLPGVVYAVGVGDEVLHQHAVGYAENRHGIVRKMDMSTRFDLASLTKVTATLPSILHLVDSGHIRLTDPVALFLPEFTGGRKSAVTIGHLLTHSSGLRSHRDYHELCRDRDEVVAMVCRESLDAPPDTVVAYTDLGFILLGEIIERVSGLRIDTYARRNVFQPLGMTKTCYRPDSSLRPEIAATEVFPGIGVKVGVVHDETADLMGGISGHAGLFAPMSDLVHFLHMWITTDETVLSPTIRRLALQCQTSHLNGCRGLGWACRHDAYDHTGDLWPETTVGHTGFTGTSMTFDSVTRAWLILLSNAVHYGRSSRGIVRLRGLVHNMIAANFRDY